MFSIKIWVTVRQVRFILYACMYVMYQYRSTYREMRQKSDSGVVWSVCVCVCVCMSACTEVTFRGRVVCRRGVAQWKGHTVTRQWEAMTDICLGLGVGGCVCVCVCMHSGEKSGTIVTLDNNQFKPKQWSCGIQNPFQICKMCVLLLICRWTRLDRPDWRYLNKARRVNLWFSVHSITRFNETRYTPRTQIKPVCSFTFSLKREPYQKVAKQAFNLKL